MDENGDFDSDLASNFQDHIFQGAQAFQRMNQLVVAAGGRLFRIGVDSWDVLDVGTSDLNPSDRYRAWLEEAEDWMIIQDGQSAPWIYNGASTVRSDTFGLNGDVQVPAGQAMCYSQGRLFVALTDARSFVVSDIVGGDSGTQVYAHRDAILYFTENDIYEQGIGFSTPINAGPLSAFRPIAQIDTSTGQGPTQVFTWSGIFSLNAPTEREQWAVVNFPIGTVSMVGKGATSDRATPNVNGDIWMRSPDGVRSFLVARRDFTTWVNTPLSEEMKRVITKDDKNLLGWASAGVADNRLLMTCQPYRKWGHGICHRGLMVLNFSTVGYLDARESRPVWEGIWTGLQVLQVVSGTFNGVERCFIFALSPSNAIELWEVTKDRTSDYDGEQDVPIEWTAEYCSCNFTRGGSPLVPGDDLQRLDGGRLWVDEMRGPVTFDVSYRADQDPCWHAWHSWQVCATMEGCNNSNCTTPVNYKQQYRKPFFLPTPTDACDTVVNQTQNVGAEFQARVKVTGSCRLKRISLTAHDEQEDVGDVCQASESCATVACSDCENDFAYSIT